MSLRRTAVLYARELRASAGNFLMIFALVVPVVFSLLINLVFGDVLSGKPVLGFYDPYNSQFTQQMMAQTHLKSSRYDSLDKDDRRRGFGRHRDRLCRSAGLR